MLLYIFFCSFIAVNSNQLIRNVLEGRSWEEKTRNRRVAEQVAGSFCYAGLDGSFCIVASNCSNEVSNVWKRFYCVFCIGWVFVQGFKQVLFHMVVLIRTTMMCDCDKFQFFWSTKPLICSLVIENPKRYKVDTRLHVHNFMVYKLRRKRLQLGFSCWCCVLDYFALSHVSTESLKAEMEQQKQKNEELEKKTARNCDITGQGQSWKWGWKRCWILFLLCIFVSCVFVLSGFKWVSG